MGRTVDDNSMHLWYLQTRFHNQIVQCIAHKDEVGSAKSVLSEEQASINTQSSHWAQNHFRYVGISHEGKHLAPSVGNDGIFHVRI